LCEKSVETCCHIPIKQTVEAKFTLQQAMKAQRGITDTALLTSALDRGGWLAPRPLYSRGRNPAPNVMEAGRPPGPVWTNTEYQAPTGFRSPDRPARSKLLYRLSYLGPSVKQTHQYVCIISRKTCTYDNCFPETCEDVAWQNKREDR
jgi:hypothetical protein